MKLQNCVTNLFLSMKNYLFSTLYSISLDFSQLERYRLSFSDLDSI